MRRFPVAVLLAVLLLNTTTASALDRPPITRPYIGGTGDVVALCQNSIANNLPTSTVSTVGGACFDTLPNDISVKITIADDHHPNASGFVLLEDATGTFIGIPLCNRETTLSLQYVPAVKRVVVQMDESYSILKGVIGSCPGRLPATRGTITAVFHQPN
ncbi:MAG TPA: hypothetical protein VI541_05670 [Actinomycetota bacterium]|nr:hypothetical protein [Actinomycetota bacterium]